MRPFRARVLVPVVALLATTAVTACEFGDQVVAVQPPQIVVHAVLNPLAAEQQVLVEQTLVGSARVRLNRRYDARDPINTGGGIPISGADVRITGPDGVLRALETATTAGGFGAGLYVAVTNGASRPRIRSGATYTLSVTTPSGAIVTGITTVPIASLTAPVTTTLTFDRDRDTLRLLWNASANARTYGLRVDSPYSPFQLFTDHTELSLPGDLRNLFSESLQRVFIPGFRQSITVYAADTNYFDYYRSRNDPFTGSGLINRLRGGIGLFGSTVATAQRIAEVTQGTREPEFEGTYVIAQSPVTRAVVDRFRLYVETSGEPAALSGFYLKGAERDGVVGSRTNGRVVLYFLRNQDANDTTAAFVGTRVADSLVGNYVGISGRTVFRRLP